jgi:hypothetical protein
MALMVLVAMLAVMVFVSNGGCHGIVRWWL